MGTALKVLIIEDKEDEALLLVGELRRCGWDVTWERVETRESMAQALDRSDFDLIVSDSLPLIQASEALALSKERGQGSPVLVVSGTMREEQAVGVMKEGARDFFVKDQLARFCPAVERELRTADERRTLDRMKRQANETLASLRRSQGLVGDLFDGAPYATVMIDAEGVIQAASRHAEMLFGYGAHELEGKAAEVLVSSPAREEYRRFWRLFLECPGDHLGHRDSSGMRKDGSVLPIEITLFPVTTELGVVIAAIRDVSDRRRLEHHLQQVQRLDWVGLVAGSFAHDLNNTLGVILLQSQIMLGAMPSNDPLRPRLEQVLAGGERAAELSRQLLGFSHKHSSGTSVLDLNQIVAGLRHILTRLVEKNVQLTVRAGEALGHIRADRARIEQILLHLTANARDAMPKGGHLTISTSDAEMDADYPRIRAGSAEGRHLCLAVTDTGHGMSRQLQARIFEPLFTTKALGAGLGLATVNGIVKESGGFIHVDSEPGRGSTFKIYLPRVDAATATS